MFAAIAPPIIPRPTNPTVFSLVLLLKAHSYIGASSRPPSPRSDMLAAVWAPAHRKSNQGIGTRLPAPTCTNLLAVLMNSRRAPRREADSQVARVQRCRLVALTGGVDLSVNTSVVGG